MSFLLWCFCSLNLFWLNPASFSIWRILDNQVGRSAKYHADTTVLFWRHSTQSNTISVRCQYYQLLSLKLLHVGLPSLALCCACLCLLPGCSCYPDSLGTSFCCKKVQVACAVWLLPCRALTPVLSMPVPPRGARVQLLFFVVPILSDRFWSAFQLCRTALSQGLRLFQQWDEHSGVLGFPASLSWEASPLRCFVGCTGLLSVLVSVTL